MNTSVKEAASLLQVSEKTIYRWIKQEIVPVYTVNDQFRFNRAELLEWAISHRKNISHEALYEETVSSAPLPDLPETLEAGGVIYRLEGEKRRDVLLNLVKELRLPDEVDREYLFKVLDAREELCPTAIGNGIAIPHPRNPVLLHVSKPTVTLAFLEEPVDFCALDGVPIHALFCLISPTVRAHLHLLSRLSYAVRNEKFAAVLKNKSSRKEIFSTLREIEKNWRNNPT